MPGREFHNRLAIMLGIDPRLANAVNKEIDEPAKWLGPRHRRERHDLQYAMKLGMKYRNWDATVAAGIHYLLDEATRDPSIRRVVRILEVLQSG